MTYLSRRLSLMLLLVLFREGAADDIGYRVTILHPAEFEGSVATSTSGATQVGNAWNGQSDKAYLWSGTADSAISLHPPGFDNTRGHAVADGYQVGDGFGPATNGQAHALLWSGSAESMVDLHPAGFSISRAFGVSGAFQVGWGATSDWSPRALWWASTAESWIDLHPEGFEWSMAESIDGSDVVGFGGTLDSSGTPRIRNRALYWSSNGVVDLTPSAYDQSWGEDVFGGRQVGSGKPSPSANSRALLWSGTAESVVDLHPTGFLTSQAKSLSHVYQVGSGLSNESLAHALRWTGSAESVLDLHEYASLADPSLTSSVAWDIALDGTIVGSASDGASNYAIVWSPVRVLGDANGDDRVDLADFGVLKDHFGTGRGIGQGDFNASGKVDLNDFGILKQNFGRTAPAPEPSTILLAAIGLLTAFVYQSRRAVRRTWATALVTWSVSGALVLGVFGLHGLRLLRAELVRYDFSGTVYELTDPNRAFPDLRMGDSVTGFIDYDTSWEPTEVEPQYAGYELPFDYVGLGFRIEPQQGPAVEFLTFAERFGFDEPFGFIVDDAVDEEVGEPFDEIGFIQIVEPKLPDDPLLFGLLGFYLAGPGAAHTGLNWPAELNLSDWPIAEASFFAEDQGILISANLHTLTRGTPPDPPKPFEWSVDDGGNGHHYELVLNAGTWEEASLQAQAMLYDGVPGHLATVTSGEEQAFLSEHFFSHEGYWLGAYQDTAAPDYAEPADGWRWVTGEPFEFEAWSNPGNGGNDVEPNDWGTGEHHMATESGHAEQLYWNDADGSGLMLGFLVEYPARSLLPGDANGDGAVDLTDFGILKANFGAGTTQAQGDFNGDGTVDLTDFGVLKENFGKSGRTVLAPEPSGVLLVALAVICLAVQGRSTWRSRFARLCSLRSGAIALVLPVGFLANFARAAELYLADLAGNAIYRISHTGEMTLYAEGGSLDQPSGLGFNSNGDLLVANYGSGTLSRVAPNGEVALFAEGLVQPDGLVVDAQGTVFTGDIDNTLRAVSPWGEVSEFAAATGRPTGVAIGGDGSLYTSTYGTNDVKKVSRESRETSVYAMGLVSPRGLAFDSLGLLYVANYEGGSVSVIAPDGAVSVFASDLVSPFGIAVDEFDRVYVSHLLDGQQSAISRIERNGQISLYANTGTVPPAFLTFAPRPIIPGDANGDGAVDLTDFGILKANFGAGTTRTQGDFNADGAIDLTDFGVLKENFGRSGANEAVQRTVQTPEPSTGALLLVASAMAVPVLFRPRTKKGT